VVAKLAATLAKPRDGATGVHIVEPGSELAFMRQFSLADIHGVGPKFQARLAKLGLRTVEDALERDLPTLTRWLGERGGKWLHDRVRGIDGGEAISQPGAKSISRDDTFSRDLDDEASLDEKLRRQVERATTDMRAAGLMARTVTVRLRDGDFTDRQASQTLPEPVESDRAVLAAARELLARLRSNRRVPARLLGVALSHFVQEESPAQLLLLDPEPGGKTDTPKDRAISHAIDELRERFGPDSIARGRTPDG
jgi:DNA polymerase-4